MYLECGFPAEAWVSSIPVASLRNLALSGHYSSTLHVRWVYTSPLKSQERPLFLSLGLLGAIKLNRFWLFCMSDNPNYWWVFWTLPPVLITLRWATRRGRQKRGLWSHAMKEKRNPWQLLTGSKQWYTGTNWYLVFEWWRQIRKQLSQCERTTQCIHMGFQGDVSEFWFLELLLLST